MRCFHNFLKTYLGQWKCYQSKDHAWGRNDKWNKQQVNYKEHQGEMKLLVSNQSCLPIADSTLLHFFIKD